MSESKSKAIILSLFVSIVLLLALEGVSRFYIHVSKKDTENTNTNKIDFMDLQNFQKGQYAIKDDLLGYRLIEGKKIGEYSFNSLGFRGGEFFPTKPTGTIRIICIGGSTTIGSNAGGDNFTYPHILEELLRKTYPKAKNIEVINAGVFGYHSWHSLLRVEKEFDRYDPDFYIFMDGLNDVMAAYAIDKKTLEHLGNGSGSPILSQLVNKKQESFVHRMSTFMRGSALYSVMEQMGKGFQGWLESLNFSLKMREKMKLFGYQKNVEQTFSLLHAKDKEIILLNYPWIVDGAMTDEKSSSTLPYKIDPSLLKLYDFGRSYTQRVNAEIAAKLSAPYIDMQPIFDKQAKEWGLKRLYSDNLHFTRYGNYLLAKAVCRELGRNQVFMQMAGPAANDGNLDVLFPDLASWRPLEPGEACMGHELVGWFGACSPKSHIDVSGLDDIEIDPLGKWRWAYGGTIGLKFTAEAGQRLRIEFAINNPIPSQGLSILANGQDVYSVKDIPAQKWLVEKVEGTCQMTAKAGENQVNLVFSKGNHQGFDFAPADARPLNGAVLHLVITNQ